MNRSACFVPTGSDIGLSRARPIEPALLCEAETFCVRPRVAIGGRVRQEISLLGRPRRLVVSANVFAEAAMLGFVARPHVSCGSRSPCLGWVRAVVFSWAPRVLALVSLCGCGDDGEPTATSFPPRPERVEVAYLSKPEAVLGWGAPRFTPDGRAISFAFAHRSRPQRRDIGLVSLSDGAFSCLTCSLPRDAAAHWWFPDGRRLLYYFYTTYNPNFYVFELERPADVLLVEGTKSSELTHDRFPVLSPDGRKLVWTKVRLDGFHMVMGDLVRTSTGYRVERVRLLYPPTGGNPDDVRSWARAHAWYEAKSFTDGGRTLVFAATRDQAANVDIYTLDLLSGEVRRVTRHPEWDETAEFSPDGRWLAFESTRAHTVLEYLSNVPLPPLIDFAAVLPITNLTLSGPLFATHEPYLLDREGDRDSYFGQRLSTEGALGWGTREGVHWSPDGTLLVWGAVLGTPPQDTHIGICRLVERRPVQPLPAVATPDPEWAPLLDRVPLRSARVDRVLAGPAGGHVRLVVDGNIASGAFSMSFEGYSEDGLHVLDGSFSLRVPVVGSAHLLADVTLRGVESGRLQVDLQVEGSEARGFIRSERGGRVLFRSF